MDEHLIETLVRSDLAYDGEFLKVRSDTVRMPDGRESKREYIRHPGAVVILPVLDDGAILMERQFRYPAGQVFVEFPAGKIDPGEDPLACAKRELREETGYEARSWQFVCTIHNAIGYSDEHLDLYLARGLTAGESRLDDGEFLETFTAPLPQLLAWVREGRITDVKTIIGLFWLEKLAAKQWSLDDDLSGNPSENSC
ncbi:MAG: NUDIX domain-containing protein [Burkholderiaceae bacterium]